jgi:hypothetical protein
MARMKRWVWVLAAVVVIGGAAAYLMLRPGSENVVLDMVDSLSDAVERRPNAEAFTVGSTTLAGQTKRSIAAKNPSRVAWNVTIPEKAWLVVSAGLLEEAWTVKGDGVVFRISLNDDEILNMVVDPFGDPGARKWNDFELDLSEFAGETVNVFLKTFASTPGRNNLEGDMPVWGEPRIVIR